ncbi:hypothetical protein WJX74_008219 [Apatococcus lobatus]|uniref:Uncharacterized protein n=1 Tax=Apatococcus lobatus TaxID=904363 RepID=A0AAW1RJP0_9CHLO
MDPNEVSNAITALTFVKGILPGDLVKAPSQRQATGILAKALEVHLNEICSLKKPVADKELRQAWMLDQAFCVAIELHSIVLTLIQKLDEPRLQAA